VVEEAATDVIAAAHARGTDEPWREPAFIDAIVRWQRERQLRASCRQGDVQFHDCSVVCTAALPKYLGYLFSPVLLAELERVKAESVFEWRVFFVRNLGFVTPSAARRISFEETLRFEKIHEETYRDYGFELIWIEPGTVEERAAAIKAAV
jgi:predicted ATPase